MGRGDCALESEEDVVWCVQRRRQLCLSATRRARYPLAPSHPPLRLLLSQPSLHVRRQLHLRQLIALPVRPLSAPMPVPCLATWMCVAMLAPVNIQGLD